MSSFTMDSINTTILTNDQTENQTENRILKEMVQWLNMMFDRKIEREGLDRNSISVQELLNNMIFFLLKEQYLQIFPIYNSYKFAPWINERIKSKLSPYNIGVNAIHAEFRWALYCKQEDRIFVVYEAKSSDSDSLTAITFDLFLTASGVYDISHSKAYTKLNYQEQRYFKKVKKSFEMKIKNKQIMGKI